MHPNLLKVQKCAVPRVLTPSEAKKLKHRYPRPNLSKMLVFKPTQVGEGGSDGVVGKQTQQGRRLYAGMPLPAVLERLVRRFPSAMAYRGPWIQVPKLIALLESISAPSLEGEINSSKSEKESGDHEIGLGQADHKPPVNDLYRSRRQNKVTRR